MTASFVRFVSSSARSEAAYAVADASMSVLAAGMSRVEGVADGRDVVLLDQRRVEPEMGVLLAVDRDGRDAVAEDEPLGRRAPGGVDDAGQEVIEPDAVRDDELRLGDLAGVLGTRLVVLGTGPGRHDRVDRHVSAADGADDVREHGRRRDDAKRVGGRSL